MRKIIINHEPQHGCYCFLDFGDHCDYFYYRDDEEEKPPRRAYTKDFSENVQYFKEWVLFIDNLKTKPGDQQKE